MNLIEQQNILKGLTDESLQAELSTPSSGAPPFLIASEVSRRKSQRERYDGARAKAQPSTVMEDLMASQIPAGMMGQPMQPPAPQGLAAAMQVQQDQTAFAEGGLVGALNYDQIGQRYADTLNGLGDRRDRTRALALLQAGAGMLSGGSSNTLTNIGKGIAAGTTAYGAGLDQVDHDEQAALANLLQLQQAQRGDELSRLQFDWTKSRAGIEDARAAAARNHFSATPVSGVDENGDTVTARFNTTTGDYAPNPRADGSIPAAFTPFSAAEVVENREQAKKDVGKLQQLPADTAAVTDSLRHATTAMNTLKKAYEGLNWSNTGPVGAMSGALPGGGWATDSRALITTLKSGLAQSALQAMRDASKTGGALGNVSDKDLELLQSNIANLDPNQGEAQLKEQLKTIYDELNAALATRVNTYEQTYANTPGAITPELQLPPPTFGEFMTAPGGVDPMDELVNRYATPEAAP